jgi:hypothetical protein
VEGNFDEWFDGGAARADGESRAYQLGDGTRVRVAGGPTLSMIVELPHGATVVIEQR